MISFQNLCKSSGKLLRQYEKYVKKLLIRENDMEICIIFATFAA